MSKKENNFKVLIKKIPTKEIAEVKVEKEIFSILSKIKPSVKTKKEIHRIIELIDLTSLEGTDNEKTIKLLCEKAQVFQGTKYQTAGVCVYPNFAKLVAKELKKTEIKTVVVAGGFPASQIPLKLKLAEVDYALKQGADEVDVTILRGNFLAGDEESVYQEIFEMSKLVHKYKKKIKVILETGELKDLNLIYRASWVAMLAGADFIKTSTGKINPGATLEAVYVMANAIKDYGKVSKRKVGLKPAGGIRNSDEAYQYIAIVQDILGKGMINHNYFRFGASSLLQNLLSQLNQKLVSPAENSNY